MNVLVLNCGSSSVKFQLIATDLDLIAQNADRRLAKGTIERIGGEAIITLQVEGREPQRSASSLRDINAAVDFIAHWAASPEAGEEQPAREEPGCHHPCQEVGDRRTAHEASQMKP